MRYFKRGTPVLVKPHFRSAAQLEATVVLDLGAPTLIVNATEDPSKMQRVSRNRVQHRRVEPASKPHTGRYYCEETEHGWCVMQRQATPPSRRDMAEGQWTLCSMWITSRAKPRKRKPTCNRCRHRLGLPDA